MYITPIQNKINPFSFKRLGIPGIFGSVPDRSSNPVSNPLGSPGSDTFQKEEETPKKALELKEAKRAVLDRNMNYLQTILTPEIDVNAPLGFLESRVPGEITDIDATILYLMARENWVEGYEYLRDNFDLDVNKKHDKGDTALHIAAGRNNIEMVKALLDNENIDPKAINNKGQTAKDIATLYGYDLTVRLIEQAEKQTATQGSNAIGEKAKPTTPKRKMTELEKANFYDLIKFEWKSCLPQLFPAGENVDIDEPIKDGWSALHFICRKGWVEGYECLKDNFDFDVNVQAVGGWTPLHFAVYSRKEDLVKKLLEHEDIDITKKNNYDRTAKDIAIMEGNTGIVRLIEQAEKQTATQGSNAIGKEAISTTPKRAMTPNERACFYNAVITKRMSILSSLFTAGENINIDEPIDDDWSGLHFIGRNGWIEGYEYLRDKFDFNVNIQKDDGWTPLHLAANNGHENLVKKLLEHEDIDITIKNKAGKTAKDIAIMEGNTGIVRLIEQAEKQTATQGSNAIEEKAKPTTPKRAMTEQEKKCFYNGINNEWESTLTQLFSAGENVDIDEPIKQDWSALHFITRNGWIKGYEYLRDKLDFDVNIQKDDGWTPLHLAAINGHEYLVKKLLEHENIDITIKNKEGSTAEDLARQANLTNIVKLLEEHNLRKTIDINNLSAENNIYSKEEINDFFELLIKRKEYNQAIEMLEKTPLLDFDNDAMLQKVGLTGNVQLMKKVFEYKLLKQKPMLEEYEQKRKVFLEKEIKELSYEELKNNQIALKTPEGFKYIFESKDFNPNDIVNKKSLFEIACSFDTEGELVGQILSKYDDVFTEKVKKSTKNKKIKTLIEEYETVGKHKVKLDKIKRLLSNPATREVGINQIKDLIESSTFNPNLVDSVGNSLLHIVSTIPDDCARGLIQKVIDKGVNINSKNMTEQNSLVGAIKSLTISKNETEKTSLLSNIKFLLDKGINVDDQDKLGQTAFHYVCITTSAALLTLFLSKNPNVFIRDIKGNRAAKYLKTDEMKKIYEKYLKSL